jgi:multiple sugar transport system substrate-binding protein
MLRVLALVVAASILAPGGAHAADLVVWWEKGYYAQEDDAVREIVAAFEQGSGKQVELVLLSDAELPDKIAFSLWLPEYVAPWAFEDRLVDLTDAVGHFSDLFDPDALDQAVLLNAKTGRKALYGLPIGRSTNHLHVWKSLLEQAGFALAGSACPCRLGQTTLGPNSSSSWPPTKLTM